MVGLGGRFSGEQSSVGEGRPSESSLSRWTWNEQRGFSACLKPLLAETPNKDLSHICITGLCICLSLSWIPDHMFKQTCLSLAARLSWWFIIALCSRQDSGPSSSRDLRFDLISCFCMNRAISYTKKGMILLINWMLNKRILMTCQFIIPPHPVPLVLLWSPCLDKDNVEMAESSVRKQKVNVQINKPNFCFSANLLNYSVSC